VVPLELHKAPAAAPVVRILAVAVVVPVELVLVAVQTSKRLVVLVY
jgi:hypothetical protein